MHNHRLLKLYPDSSRAKKMLGWWLIVVALGAVKGEETCLSGAEDPYLLFGTKTSYIFSNKDTPAVKAHEVPGCEPTAVWLLNRHGSNNPEANEFAELQKLSDFKNNIITNYNHQNFRNTGERMCSSDLDLLKQWTWDYRKNMTYAGDLTSDGYMTTQQLAQAWKHKFPGVLTSNQYDYLFKFVNDQRSSNSFKAFTEGLFGDQAESFDIPKENDEKLLRPYKFCPSWTKEVEENNDTVSQLVIFESKQEYKDMINNISRRLGFSWEVQKETILSMYQMCRYNKAWAVDKISPWCAAFTREDLKRLEYAEDLETYYKYGYGSPLNEKVGCTVVKDMMNFLEKQLGDDTVAQKPRAMVHFTEAAMLLMSMAALGAHKDLAPLTGDNYHSAVVQSSRMWTTSAITPYNANLAAVLYKCTLNGNFQVKEQHQVLFLENEKPMSLEGCRLGLCGWSLVKQKYADVAAKCDLEFCNSANKLNTVTALSITAIAFLLNSFVNRISL